MEVMSRAGGLQLPCLPLPTGPFLTRGQVANGSVRVYGSPCSQAMNNL